MGGDVRGMDPEIARRNEAFLKRLRGMRDEDLAYELERYGTFIAPNPHYVLEAARRLRAHAEREKSVEARTRPSQKPETPNYTYVECAMCNRLGTPRCRKKGHRWSPCVIPGCMELVKDAQKFMKSEGGSAE